MILEYYSFDPGNRIRRILVELQNVVYFYLVRNRNCAIDVDHIPGDSIIENKFVRFWNESYNNKLDRPPKLEEILW